MDSSRGRTLSNKYDAEVKAIFYRAEIVKNVSSTIKYLIFYSFMAYAVYMFFGTIQVMAQEKPDSVSVLLTVAAKFQLDVVVSWAWALGATYMWHRERKLKQNCIKRVSEQRHIIEGNDAYRASSGLDHKGQTPKAKGRS